MVDTISARCNASEHQHRTLTRVLLSGKLEAVQEDNDTHMYKWRHLIENDFAKIKEFRGMATRYDKADTSHAANWSLSAMLIAAR